MDRLTLSQTEDEYIVSERAANKLGADNGQDDDLDPKDRRNRASVCGPNCTIKEGDDIRQREQTDVFRVIGAARGEEWLNVLAQTPWGSYTMPIDGRNVEDRAPADPQETALPIWTDTP